MRVIILSKHFEKQDIKLDDVNVILLSLIQCPPQHTTDCTTRCMHYHWSLELLHFLFSVPLDLRFQRKFLKRALSWKPKSPGSSHLDKDKGWCELKTSTVALAQTVYSPNNWAIMPGLFLSSAPLQSSLYFVIGGGTITLFTVKIAVNNVMCQYI